MMDLAIILTTAIGLADIDKRCQPSDCLKSLTSRVAVSVVDVSASQVAGVWEAGGGLSGSNLYLFSDGTYIYAQWADIQPETIYDKGRWQIADGVIVMSADRDIIWNPESDRRYLCVRQASRATPMLVGIDVSLEHFVELVDSSPDTTGAEWLRVVSFKQQKSLTARESDRLKTDLLRSSWRPEYFTAKP